MSKPTRRNLLRCIGTGAVGYGLIGNAAARTPGGGSRLVVGTDSSQGMHASRVKAKNVEREIDFGARGKAVVGEFSDESVAELESRSDVRYVEDDVPVFALPATAADDVSASDQGVPWGIERVGAETAHDDGHTGSGAHIAILDTGIDAEHPDLAPSIGEGYAIEECDDDCAAPWDDDHTHGTHCAGIAAAVDNGRGVVGVGAGATLHSVKVLSNEGSGSATGVAEGIKWAADQGYEVISMSLGATQGASIIQDALQYAQDAGSLVVAAAGNEGPCIDCVHYPGAYPEAVAVGSINRFDDLSEFSSTGDEVEVVAPGTEIMSTVTGGGYRAYSGTSMATPHVAGAAAVLMSEGRSAQETRELLRSSAEDLGLDDRESGAGLLNLDAAVGDGGGGGGDDPATFAVTTRAPTSVTETAATLNGRLNGLGEERRADVGFDIWVQGEQEETRQSFDAGRLREAGDFSTDVEGLDNGTTYEYVATGAAGDQTVAGEVQQLVPQRSAAVETAQPTDVTTNSATLVGNLTDLAGEDSVTVGLRCWVPGDREATLRETDTERLDEPGEFAGEVDGLQQDTGYVAAAYASTEDGEVAGNEVSFRTGQGGSAPFSITTLDADWVGDRGARLNGEVTDLGGAREIETAFVYWPVGDESAREEEDAEDTDEPDDFDELVLWLEPDTTYRFAAVGYDDNGNRVVANTKEFTTEAE
jgi:subtilisin family serine protease